MTKVVVIDNYDSFTWNLAHLISSITGEMPSVFRNDEITSVDVLALEPSAIILSPGPGHPANSRDFGICSELLATATSVPILGVCLGHQGLAHFAGCTVVAAPRIIHGQVSRIRHDRDPLFRNIPQNFQAVRYHSLVVVEPLPKHIRAIAWASDGDIMAIRHTLWPHYGVQFHPESILSEHGETLLRNFLQPPEFTRHDFEHFIEPEQAYVSLFAGDDNSVWLDSSLTAEDLSRYSFMGGSSIPGAYLLTGDVFETMAAHVRGPATTFGFHGGFVGYLGYEVKEKCGYPNRHAPVFPAAQFLYLPAVLGFDHCERKMFVSGVAGVHELAARVDRLSRTAPVHSPPAGLTGTLRQDRAAYTDKVHACQFEMRRGETYEACLTNEWVGDAVPDPLAFYLDLRERNPAPYSAFVRFGPMAVACSSPERFLRIDHNRVVSSKPIKGTAPLGNPEILENAKNRSEHLMIVDLVRNDLGRVAKAGSVHVSKLFGVEDYATVHQLVSTIEAELRDDASVFDCIRAAFPPGSMTGAPKHRTIEILDALEDGARGIYSGAIGYIGLDGCVDLNVAIRTAVFTASETRVGAGGAIIALSDADEEWEEMLLKLRAVLPFAGGPG